MDGRLRAALRALDEAEHDAPAGMPGSSKGHSFAFDIAQDRAAIWFRLGDTPKAISYMQKAIRLNPDDLEAWSHMAVLYQRAGRTADQKIAEERGKALTAAHRTHQN